MFGIAFQSWSKTPGVQDILLLRRHGSVIVVHVVLHWQAHRSHGGRRAGGQVGVLLMHECTHADVLWCLVLMLDACISEGRST